MVVYFQSKQLNFCIYRFGIILCWLLASRLIFDQSWIALFEFSPFENEFYL